ncbi:MAG: PfkB family carbohydrate kinase, partial [Achromobacter sp.]
MATPVLVCGSMAFDTIAVFEGHFKEHILADRIQSLSVSFLVPSMRKEYGGCSGNIAYNMNLLGGKPVPVATVGEDAGEYLARLSDLGIDVSRVKVIPD